jgi:hypothetical protein
MRASIACEPVTNWRVSEGLSWSGGMSDQRVWRTLVDIVKEYSE